jgi:hypothetical protein
MLAQDRMKRINFQAPRALGLLHTVLCFSACHAAQGSSLRAGRALAGEYYHTLTTADLGIFNPDVAIGNPLKGLVENPVFTNPPYRVDIPLAVELHFTGLQDVMNGNPRIIGEAAAFNWTIMDRALAGSATRKMHAMFRPLIDYPGVPALYKLPKYLIDAGAEFRSTGTGTSPFYGDPLIVEALEQFIKAFGRRYNGDKRLAAVQAGLLGYFGEWNTIPYPHVPEDVKDKVVSWYAGAFPNTQVQIRTPRATAFAAGLGLHDEAFAYQTLDGVYNCGQNRSFYFWNNVAALKKTDFWKTSMMGGTTRASLQQEVFEPNYNRSTFQKQDFLACVNVTHATYIWHHAAFR